MNKPMKKIFVIVIGVVMMLGLFGCGKGQYKLQVDTSVFSTKKTNYNEGEMVKVSYDMIATDTDYTFFTDSPDVTLQTSYDDKLGYVIEFPMPAHDVHLDVTSKNSMCMPTEP